MHTTSCALKNMLEQRGKWAKLSCFGVLGDLVSRLGKIRLLTHFHCFPQRNCGPLMMAKTVFLNHDPCCLSILRSCTPATLSPAHPQSSSPRSPPCTCLASGSVCSPLFFILIIVLPSASAWLKGWISGMSMYQMARAVYSPRHKEKRLRDVLLACLLSSQLLDECSKDH